MVLEKPNAISEWRALIGPTDASKAKISHPRRSDMAIFFFFFCYHLFDILGCWLVKNYEKL